MKRQITKVVDKELSYRELDVLVAYYEKALTKEADRTLYSTTSFGEQSILQDWCGELLKNRPF